MDYAYALLDKGLIPDAVLRPVIRQLCRKRLREINHGTFPQGPFLLPRILPSLNRDRPSPSCLSSAPLPASIRLPIPLPFLHLFSQARLQNYSSSSLRECS